MNDDQSRLELRKGELYRPGSKTSGEELHALTPEAHEVASGWSNATIERPAAPIMAAPKPPVPTSIKVLRAFTAVVVAGALSAFGYLGYQLLQPGVRSSTDLIDVKVDAPVGVSPDRPADITVSVTNRNDVALEGAEVTFILPDGAYLTDASGTPTLSREFKTQVGVIASGETATRKVGAYILGAEQEEKKVAADVSFSFFGIEARFDKREERSVRVTGSPVIVTVDSLKRVSSGAPFTAKYTIKSNTVVPLSGELFTLAYPPGFVFSSADPQPISGSTWVLPNLDQGKSTDITISGAFAGEGAAERVFQMAIGSPKVDDHNVISAVLARNDLSIGIEAPFINAALMFDGKPAVSAIAKEGVRLNGVLSLTNATQLPIDHVVAELKMNGAFDTGSVDASMNGIYRAALGNIVWDERSDPRLSTLAPGETVRFEFAVSPKIGRTGASALPSLSFVANVHATRTSEAGVSGDASTLAEATVPLATQAEFIARATHFVGPFHDDGPIPPKVDQPTKYTVVWSLRNTTNTLEGGVVKGTLSPAVDFTGQVDTESTSTIVYDPDTHEVSWNVGRIPAGVGAGATPPKEVSFQLVFTPALGMLGKTPTLMAPAEFSAADSVTKQSIKSRSTALDIKLTGDPQAPSNAGTVIQ